MTKRKLCNIFKSKNKTIVTCDPIDTYQYRLHWVEWYPVGKGSTLPLGIWCPAPPRVGNWGRGLSSPLSTGELVHWGWLAPPRSNESYWSSHWRTWAYTSQLGLKYIETLIQKEFALQNVFSFQNCPQPLHPYKQTLKEKILLLDVSVGFFFLRIDFIKKEYKCEQTIFLSCSVCLWRVDTPLRVTHSQFECVVLVRF